MKPTRPRGVVFGRAVIALAVVSVACGKDGPGTQPSDKLSITSVQPATAPSGAEVRLYGSGFKQGATVTIGERPATVSAIFDSQIVVVTPPDHPLVNVHVVVTNPDGQTAKLTGGFTFIPLAITLLAPNVGFENLKIRVFGTGFMPGSRVSIGGTPAPLLTTIVSTGFMITAPQRGLGPADFTVTIPGGGSITIPGGFTYYPLPVISVTPTTVAAGERLIVSWVVSLESGFDWIGLYKVGTDNFSYLDWKYTSGLTGAATFNAPTLPGNYEFRYLPMDDYDDFARTATVTVTSGSQVAASPPLRNRRGRGGY